MKSKLIILIICLASILLFGYQYLIYQNNRPLGFDESFNLQIPESIYQEHNYKSRYIPQRNFDTRISSGFPLHILSSIFLGNKYQKDNVIIFCSIVFILLLTVILYITKSPIYPTFLIIISITSPQFRQIFTEYLGETLSIIFLLLSIYFIKKKNKLSIFLLALALSTKYIAIFSIPIYWLKFKDNKKFFDYIFKTFISFGIMQIILLIFSYSGIPRPWQIKQLIYQMKDFLFLNSGTEHISFSLKQACLKFRYLDNFFYNSIGILLIFLSSLKSSKSKIFSVFYLLLYYYCLVNTQTRHFLIFLILLIVIFRNNISKLLILLLIIVNILNFKNIDFFMTNTNNTNSIIKQNQKEIASFIKNKNFNIYTSGWWQSPEISYLTNIKFKDRMSFNNKAETNAYLLTTSIQENYWPNINLQEFCSETILCHNSYYLCKINSKYNLDTNIYPSNTIPNESCKIY